MGNLQNNKNSLLQFAKNNMSGVNVPWMYVGMKYSTFCWHYEDLMLHSINYNHAGKPKLWYAVPESYREKLEKAIKQRYALLFQSDPNLLLDNITMTSPAYLISKGITVTKTLQRPGEFVVTFPGSYHAGFSTGLNVGEAVNFMTKSWFDFGFKCQNLYRASRQRIPVFPIEWICVENIRNLQRLALDKDTLQALAAAFNKIL